MIGGYDPCNQGFGRVVAEDIVGMLTCDVPVLVFVPECISMTHTE